MLSVANLQETANFAQSFALSLVSPSERTFVVWLDGELGVGKTSLVRFILQHLNYQGRVKSPTYSLIESYPIVVYPDSRLYLHHFDLYRFNSPNEFCEAGLEEYFTTTNFAFIEWAEKGLPYTPTADVIIKIQYTSEISDSRQMEISAASKVGDLCLNRLKIQLKLPNNQLLQISGENS